MYCCIIANEQMHFLRNFTNFFLFSVNANAVQYKSIVMKRIISRSIHTIILASTTIKRSPRYQASKCGLELNLRTNIQLRYFSKGIVDKDQKLAENKKKIAELEKELAIKTWEDWFVILTNIVILKVFHSNLNI